MSDKSEHVEILLELTDPVHHASLIRSDGGLPGYFGGRDVAIEKCKPSLEKPAGYILIFIYGGKPDVAAKLGGS